MPSLPLLLLLFSCITCHALYVDDHVVYGNDYDQAMTYFNSTSTFVNTTAYFHSLMLCGSQQRYTQCLLNSKNDFLPKVRWWSTISFDPRQISAINPDCNYNVTFMSMEHENSDRTVFIFQIAQYSCQTNISSGTSFHAIGMTHRQLVGCRVIDDFNNTYLVKCHFHRQETCMNLTLLLDREHYDGFDDEASSSLRYIVSNNVEYCSPSHHRHINLSHHKGKFELNDHVTFISCRWMRNDSHSMRPSHPYDYPNESYVHNIYEHRRRYNLTNFQFNEKKGVNVSQLPDVIFGETGQQYVSHITVIPPRPLIDNSSNPFQSSMKYHLFGSSHLRYDFDAILEHFYLKEGMSHFGLPDHNGFIELMNMNSYFDYKKRIILLFIDDQVDLLQSICTQASVHPKTIIFQPGAWDMMYMPLRRMLFDPVAGQKLVSIVSSILTGSTNCPQLKHFIWMTAVPYPYCFDDDYLCIIHRGFRVNPSIRAMNEFFLEAFLKLKIRDGLMFTVIDAYSIIHPRLFFLPDREITKSNHYLGRMPKDTQSRGDDMLGHTPAGDTVVKALLTAISLGL